MQKVNNTNIKFINYHLTIFNLVAQRKREFRHKIYDKSINNET